MVLKCYSVSACCYILDPVLAGMCFSILFDAKRTKPHYFQNTHSEMTNA